MKPFPYSRRLLLPLAAFVASAATALGQTAHAGPPEDARLQKPITLHLRAKPVKQVLAEISETTGVQMRPSADVAELRLSVFVKNLSLHTLQSRIADVLHLSWEVKRSDDPAPPAYLLYRSRRNRDEAERLAQRREQAHRKRLEEAIAALARSPEAIDAMIKQRPDFIDPLTFPSVRRNLGLLGQLSPTQRAHLYQGNRLSFNLYDLPPALQKQINDTRAARDPVDLSNTIIAGNASPEEAQRILNTPPKGTVTTIRFERSSSGQRIGIRVFGTVNGHGRFASLLGEVGGLTVEDEVYKDVFYPERSEEEYAAARRKQEIEKSIASTNFDEWLEKLAAAAGINIVSESYVERNARAYALPAGETTMEETLDRLVSPNNRLWWKKGDVYLIHKKYWFKEQLASIPEEMLKRVKAILKDRYASLEDWAELGRLTRPQWGSLNSLGLAEPEALESMEPLATLFAALSPAQRTWLFRPSGLRAGALRPAVQERLRRWVQTQGMTDFDAPASMEAARGVLLTAEVGEQRTSLRAYAVDSDGSLRLLREGRMPLPRAQMERRRKHEHTSRQGSAKAAATPAQ